MQELVTEKKKQRRGKGFALRICKLYYQTERIKNIYKRSINKEGDQKPKRETLRGK